MPSLNVIQSTEPNNIGNSGATHPNVESRSAQIISIPSARYYKSNFQRSFSTTDVEGPLPPPYADVCVDDSSNARPTRYDSANPNVNDNHRFTPTQAISGGSQHVVIEPLTQAIIRGTCNQDVVIELLDYGANPDVKDSHGSALTQAIRGGNQDVVIKLVQLSATKDGICGLK